MTAAGGVLRYLARRRRRRRRRRRKVGGDRFGFFRLGSLGGRWSLWIWKCAVKSGRVTCACGCGCCCCRLALAVAAVATVPRAEHRGQLVEQQRLNARLLAKCSPQLANHRRFVVVVVVVTISLDKSGVVWRGCRRVFERPTTRRANTARRVTHAGQESSALATCARLPLACLGQMRTNSFR